MVASAADGCDSRRSYAREVIIGNLALAPGSFELRTSWSGTAPRPGQFFMLRAARSQVLLGRPISVYDAGPLWLSFAITGRGPGTLELSGLQCGDAVMLEGPLGSAWKDRGVWPHTGAARGEKPLALVGGGIGLAPLLFLAKELGEGSYDLHAGFRSGCWGLHASKARRLLISTEDGSVGNKGRVLDSFEAHDYAMILACGPEPMLRAVAELAKAAAVPALLGLERRMACGVGACLGCAVRTTGGNRRACVEGPIFAAEELLFDE
ncbi:MAG: dihydroorotate dehydrogenase electron transfer subunit [Spirochaetota bacterium]